MNTLEQDIQRVFGFQSPWYMRGLKFDHENKRIDVSVDFEAGTRFPHPDAPGLHPVHDTVRRTFRDMSWSRYHVYLNARIPRIRLPDNRVVQVQPEWAGRVPGFTLSFEAMILAFGKEMPCSTVEELTETSYHSIMTVLHRYVETAEATTDLSGMTSAAVDETSYKKGQKYVTIVADAEKRKIVFVTLGRGADTIGEFAEHLKKRNASPDQIDFICMDMSPAFISGAGKYLGAARITFDKFHVIAHASEAIDETRRLEQKLAPELKGKRWLLLKDRSKLNPADRAELDKLIASYTTVRTARAWLYREQLRDILDHKQINVVARMLKNWCSRVLRSKVLPMHNVALMIRKHFDGIIAWAQTRQTNGFLEAINGLFQTARRRARGYTCFRTMRTILFLIAGDLDFAAINPFVAGAGTGECPF